MTMNVDERPVRRYARPPKRVEFPSEAEVPESKRHLELRTMLYQIVKLALGDRALVGSDQFVYWDATDPTANLAPDLFVRMGAPDENFASWKTWERGAPHVAVEIVSPSDAGAGSLEEKLGKYYRLGITELVRFQPEDPRSPLRVWDYVEGDLVEREVAPGGLAECVPLGLWWTVKEDEDLGPVLRLSRDPGGSDLLPTELELRKAAEAKHQAADAKHQAAEAARDAALEEVRALKKELSKRR
jgi:Uma2 family endonuclease